MAAEVPVTTSTVPARARLRPWLRVAAAALVLLLASEALWLWQTWPVRSLLQARPAPTAGVR